MTISHHSLLSCGLFDAPCALSPLDGVRLSITLLRAPVAPPLVEVAVDFVSVVFGVVEDLLVEVEAPRPLPLDPVCRVVDGFGVYVKLIL